MTLDDLVAGVSVAGIDPAGTVHVVAVEWHGSSVVTLTYRDQDNHVQERLLFHSDVDALEIVDGSERRWSFDADGDLFRLVAEARRIKLAHLFDPMLAITTSQIDPLPHQIQAVYGEMLPRQPLRFLLADDPGAGKTIMAGLYIKELMLRGDAARVVPKEGPPAEHAVSDAALRRSRTKPKRPTCRFRPGRAAQGTHRRFVRLREPQTSARTGRKRNRVRVRS